VKILIATPAYGGVVHTAYHEAVLATVLYFQQNFPGIAFETRTLSLSVISMARNVFASMVLDDPSFTHLLFIDADMGFSPSLIARMLAFGKPLTGIIAPQRRLEYEAYHKARETVTNPAIARVVANDYVGSEDDLRRNEAGEVEVVDGFVAVSRAGTGIMLIERAVLEAMREHYPKLWLAETDEKMRRMGLAGGLLQCFDPLRDQNGVGMGEDVSFCLRWTIDLKGEIWANIDEPIVHVGQDSYTGHYLSKLQATGARLKVIARE
jgi:hypothetical protein